MGFFSGKRPNIPESDYVKGVATEVYDSKIFHTSDGNVLTVTNRKLGDLVLSRAGRIEYKDNIKPPFDLNGGFFI